MTEVLVIAPTPFFSDRGCHVRIFELSRSLQKLGYDPLILTYPAGEDPPGVSVTRMRGWSWYRKVEAGPAWPRLLIDLSLLKQAARLLREQKPKLVYAFLHEGCAIARVLRPLYGVPFVFDYQGSMTMESLQHGFIREGWLEKAFRAAERRLDASADHIVTSAAELGRDLEERGLPVSTVPDGVDPDRFSPGEPEASLRARLGLPDDMPLLVYLGVMSDYQGVDILLDSALILQREGVSAHFLLMGYPEDFYKDKAKAMGLGDSVTFTGRVDYFKAADYLRLGAAALAPKLSRTESNGKVLNYMACGLPVVAFDLAVNRELLGSEAEWATVAGDRQGCAEEFARAIADILSDRDKAARLSEAGRKRAVENFSLERQAEKLAHVCANVIARAG
ncbi:MAG: glycosyltransferase family 4 protein [bacterium]